MGLYPWLHPLYFTNNSIILNTDNLEEPTSNTTPTIKKENAFVIRPLVRLYLKGEQISPTYFIYLPKNRHYTTMKTIHVLHQFFLVANGVLFIQVPRCICVSIYLCMPQLILKLIESLLGKGGIHDTSMTLKWHRPNQSSTC